METDIFKVKGLDIWSRQGSLKIELVMDILIGITYLSLKKDKK